MSDEGGNADRFTEEDVATYLELADFVVPARERLLTLVCDLIPRRREPFQVLDLGCGDGILAEAILRRYSHVTVHGIDASPTMLERAAERLAFAGKRFYAHQFELASVGWRRIAKGIGSVVSILAIHHLSPTDKRNLFRDVHRILLPRGAFIVADLVMPTTDEGLSVAAREWDRSVYERSLQHAGDAQHYERFREARWNYFVHPDPADRPSALFEQLRWLEQVGFRSADVHWMEAGHALFSAVKAGG